jgi:cytidylate kinase
MNPSVSSKKSRAPQAPVITIDGPAASGKSSLSRELARRLGFAWISTGAFYRGLAFVAHSEGVDIHDQELIASLSLSAIWSVQMSEKMTHVFLKGQDVTEEIFRENIGNLASTISQYPEVRQNMLDAQRRCALNVKGLIAEGRDCGSVVFPAAKVKIYLTASAEDRAARRAKDEGKSVVETISQQKIRDQQDSSRKAAPLQIPAEAFVVDNSNISFEAVVKKVEEHIRQALGLS